MREFCSPGDLTLYFIADQTELIKQVATVLHWFSQGSFIDLSKLLKALNIRYFSCQWCPLDKVKKTMPIGIQSHVNRIDYSLSFLFFYFVFCMYNFKKKPALCPKQGERRLRADKHIVNTAVCKYAYCRFQLRMSPLALSQCFPFNPSI